MLGVRLFYADIQLIQESKHYIYIGMFQKHSQFGIFILTFEPENQFL
jgi:hypothetical protein